MNDASDERKVGSLRDLPQAIQPPGDLWVGNRKILGKTTDRVELAIVIGEQGIRHSQSLTRSPASCCTVTSAVAASTNVSKAIGSGAGSTRNSASIRR